MYLCVKGIYFAYDFFTWILKLFRQCGIFFFFISLPKKIQYFVSTYIQNIGYCYFEHKQEEGSLSL
jgi:hypothetical protein